ncbi:MAG: HEPN domain-containing protein, partial [Endomicrobium sp.]|nr:HEPN domain-containing protein [Endomicrobium sp.]
MNTNEKIINFWLKGSDENLVSMEHFFSVKEYHWALFVGHLTIEKLLKALFLKNNPKEIDVPRTHNLVFLAQKANLALTDEQKNDLALFTTFNIEARYPDYKLKIYKI